jgi:phage terminase large subunit-like protein
VSKRTTTTTLAPPQPVATTRYARDPVRFIDECITVNERGRPFRLTPTQRAVLTAAFMFDRRGQLAWTTFVYSCPKKSGKTTINAALLVWWAFTQDAPNELLVLANDLEQSTARVFTTARKLITRNPQLAASAVVLDKARIVLTNDTEIKALASEYAGAAGSGHGMTSFDELWGATSENSRRLWDELTPVPTDVEHGLKNSIRLVTTYAGWEGESDLLWDLYVKNVGPEEHPQGPGVRIHPTIPLYFNAATRTLIYWDHAPQLPSQSDAYYTAQRAELRPGTYLRLHENRWTTAETRFLEPAQVDACIDREQVMLGPWPVLPIWVGLDLGLRRDNAGVIALTVDGDGDPLLVRHRLWRPAPTQPLELQVVEDYLAALAVQYAIQLILADPWQAAGLIQRLAARGLPIQEFPQTQAGTTKMGQALWDAVTTRRLRLYPDADVRTHLLNCVAIESDRGFRIAKEKTSKKIDLAVALSLALVGASEALATPGVNVEALEELSEEDHRIQRDVATFWGIPGIETHPDYVPPDAEGVYDRDLRWSRSGADDSRRPLW